MTGRIVLTSAGFKVPNIGKDIRARLSKKPEETKIAHIVTAANVAPDIDFVKRDKQAMLDLGFQVTDLSLEARNKKELYQLLQDFDVIYVQGGNGFYLLRHIRESGFEEVIKKLLDEGKWYVGVSAGSYVCCPTIEMHTWKREPDTTFGLTDFTAMNLVPFLVTVHYNREKYRELLASKLPTASAPVRILTDEQALIVTDEEVEFIGNEPEIKKEDIL